MEQLLITSIGYTNYTRENNENINKNRRSHNRTMDSHWNSVTWNVIGYIMKTSPIDSVIIDLILDHYNIQSMRGKKQSLSGADFDNLVADAKEEYYKRVLRDEEKGEA